jgi:hypothetical protein
MQNLSQLAAVGLVQQQPVKKPPFPPKNSQKRPI